MADPYFDWRGNLRCAGGESLRLRLGIRRPDGDDADLTGSSFVFRVLTRSGALALAGSELDGVEDDGTIVCAASGARATVTIPGAVTKALEGRIGLTFQWARLTTGGREDVLGRALTVAKGGPLVEGSAPIGEIDIVTDDRGTVIISTLGAPGITPKP